MWEGQSWDLAMPRLAHILLGAPRIEHDCVLLDITIRKAIALLAYLAVNGLPHTRDALATLFWPEADQERARGALRHTMAQLKAVIGDGWLQMSRVHEHWGGLASDGRLDHWRVWAKC